MFKLLPLVGLLQIICIYLAFKNKVDYWWYFIIICFPFLGSIAFLYFNFYSRDNVENLQESVKSVFVDNYEIKKLKHNLTISDTHNNRIALANEYFNVGNYNKAKEIYLTCKKGMYANDVDLNIHLLETHYSLEEYNEVVEIAEQIKDEKLFQTSKAKIGYAWALNEIGNIEKASSVFQEMEIDFSNYEQRYEYIRFLDLNNSPLVTSKLEKLRNEINLMDSYEKRYHKPTINKINTFYKNR